VILLFIGCSGLSGEYGLALLITNPLRFVLALGFATATAVPYGALLLWTDRNEKEPLYLIVMAFMWGALVATSVSLLFNDMFAAVAETALQDPILADRLGASISAPFIEELTKGTALLFIFIVFQNEFDNVLDGIVYGSLIGLGFAWFENILYYVQAGAEGGLWQMGTLAFVRGVLSGMGSHAAYTGLTGLGFGLVRVLRQGTLRWLLIPFFLGLAMFAHFIWNTFVGFFVMDTYSEAMTLLVSFPTAVLVLQAPFLLLLLLVVVLAWRHENHIITHYLQDESEQVVRATTVAHLVPARKRNLTALRRLLKKGPAYWWHSRTLEQALIQLAFTKWHHEQDPETVWTADQDADVVRQRRRIRVLRKNLTKGSDDSLSHETKAPTGDD